MSGMWLLALAGAAAAFTADRLGGYVDFGLGAAVAGPAPALAMGIGFWRGKYDEELSFGRFWSVGLGVAQSVPADSIRTAWMVEVRRGMDLIVGGVHGFAAVGPVLVQGDAREVGVAGRLGGAVELRRTSTLGIGLRLEAGVDALDGEVAPAGALTVGFQTVFARESK
jgi:hypothetical protein